MALGLILAAPIVPSSWSTLCTHNTIQLSGNDTDSEYCSIEKSMKYNYDNYALLTF